MKLKHSLKPYMKINWKWIKGLIIRLDTIKLLEENRTFWQKLDQTFLAVSPKVKKIKTKWINGT